MDWSSITPAVVIAVCSFCTAICSLFVTLSNFRRSNYSIIRIIESSASYHEAVGRGKYYEFRVVVQNFGIPLHNIGMSLENSDEDGFGWGKFPMKTADGKYVRDGQFAKGAITEFCLSTDRLDHNFDGFIRHLTNLKLQRACLTIHADKYRMWSFRLHDRVWGLKRRWNRAAFWLNRKTAREVTTTRGTKGTIPRFDLPSFESAGRDIIRFAEWVRKSPPSEPVSKNVFRPGQPPPGFPPRPGTSAGSGGLGG